MNPKNIRDFSELGKKGGNAVLKKYGPSHFKELVRKREAKRLRERAELNRLRELAGSTIQSGAATLK